MSVFILVRFILLGYLVILNIKDLLSYIAFLSLCYYSPLLNLVGHKKIDLGKLMDKVQCITGKEKVNTYVMFCSKLILFSLN